MGMMSSRTQTASSVMTQRQMCGPPKVLCHISYLTTALCHLSVFPTDPTHHDQKLHVFHLPFAMTCWPLTIQMGNHFKITAFFHAAQLLTQPSGTLSQAGFYLNQRRAQLTCRGVIMKASEVELNQEPQRSQEAGLLTQQAAVQTLCNPKSCFHRWLNSLDAN